MSDQTPDSDGELGDFESFRSSEDENDEEEQVERKAKNTVAEATDDVDEGGATVEEVYESMVELIPEDELGKTNASEVAEAAAKVVRAGSEAENPLDLDPRIGVKDICFDRAKPGAKVYVVDVLGETVEDYYEEFADAPALDEYAGNVVVRMNDEDAVFACVYVKDSLTSVDTNITAYPMPESRLTRFPAEQASMVGESEVEFARTTLPGGEE